MNLEIGMFEIRRVEGAGNEEDFNQHILLIWGHKCNSYNFKSAEKTMRSGIYFSQI